MATREKAKASLKRDILNNLGGLDAQLADLDERLARACPSLDEFMTPMEQRCYNAMPVDALISGHDLCKSIPPWKRWWWPKPLAMSYGMFYVTMRLLCEHRWHVESRDERDADGRVRMYRRKM